MFHKDVPLGLQDNRITKSQLTASSVLVRKFDAHYARVNGQQLLRNAGAWCAKLNNRNQWISVNLSMPRLVSGVITQGRDETNQWVTKFKIKYSNDSVSWHYMMDLARQGEKARTFVFHYQILNKCR